MTSIVQLRRLVGNPAAYAKQNPDGSWTPVREELTNAVLAGHLGKRYTIGTYVGHKDALAFDGTRARTLVLDFDTGDAAVAEATAAMAALEDLGCPSSSVGMEFSGKKGYHVWFVLKDYVPNKDLRRLGRAALTLASLPLSTEVFPKQDEVTDLGNLVKLPAGKHQVTGQANDFVTPFPMPCLPATWETILAGLPVEQQARSTTPVDSRFPCIETIQEGVQEGGRNIQLLHLATMFRRHGMTEETLRVVLEHVNGLGDPLDERELEALLHNSARTGPICSQLPQDMQDECGNHCIKARLQGLSLKPGQLRHAEEDELVVVRVVSREDDTVALQHDDLAANARGKVRTNDR